MRTINSAFAFILFVSVFISCNKKKEEDKNTNTNKFNIPTLNFEFTVSGALDRSVNFISPENNNTKGGHGHGIVSVYSSVANTFSISGSGPDYNFTLNSAMNGGVSKGTSSISYASFVTTSEGSFGEIQSGSITLTDVKNNFSSGVSTYYDVSGNFTVTIKSSSTGSTEIITFTGSFTGLNVTAS